MNAIYLAEGRFFSINARYESPPARVEFPEQFAEMVAGQQDHGPTKHGEDFEAEGCCKEHLGQEDAHSCL